MPPSMRVWQGQLSWLGRIGAVEEGAEDADDPAAGGDGVPGAANDGENDNGQDDPIAVRLRDEIEEGNVTHGIGLDGMNGVEGRNQPLVFATVRDDSGGFGMIR